MTQIHKSRIKYSFTEEVPKLIYTDITETEMFGFPEITKKVLTDSGLWADHGVRKLKFYMSCLTEKADEYENHVKLHFNKRNNDSMETITMEAEIASGSCEDEGKTYEMFAYVYTNELGNVFDKTKQKNLFSGYLDISFISKTDRLNDVTYCFPVELQLNNTMYKPGERASIPLQKKTVSIDFGTSSTCVAVQGENGIELLTLSAGENSEDDINIYENPTYIMIYRWNEIYHQWRAENFNLPMMIKGNLDEAEQGDKEVQFDFGYSVKRCLNKVSDKELNAIVSDIKMIPKILEAENQLLITPLIPQDIRTVEIVSSCNKQNKESLDAVAFYGYILGKAINRVEKNKIYTKYQITYPVKFSEEVKKRMCASLEYGLKRSIPIPLREAVDARKKPVFKVEAKYPEPVAYIGSICGRYLKIDREDQKGKLFAVYDFGGGTLDYSFGIFTPDKREPNRSCINILGVDGDSFIGGEHLIRRMSYWIYISPTNMQQLIENKIPFEQPDGEVRPDNDQLEGLFQNSVSAKANVRKISERITRNIFEGKYSLDMGRAESMQAAGNSRPLRPTRANSNVKPEVNLDTEITESVLISDADKAAEEFKKNQVVQKSNVEQIEFMDLYGETKSIHVSFDIREIEERLQNILLQTVSSFKEDLKRVFESRRDALRECGIDSFKIEDVHIFKAGNSSKNRILGKIMEEQFPDNIIMLVDETSDEFMADLKQGEVLESKPKQIAITPKTAVALGQLRLSDYYVNKSYILNGHPFNWYVGTINGGTNEFVVIIDRVNQDEKWHRYGHIHSLDMKIHYTDTSIKDADCPGLRSVELDEYMDEDCQDKYLYIKIKNSDTISCCVCEQQEQLETSCDTFDILLQ